MLFEIEGAQPLLSVFVFLAAAATGPHSFFRAFMELNMQSFFDESLRFDVVKNPYLRSYCPIQRPRLSHTSCAAGRVRAEKQSEEYIVIISCVNVTRIT